MNERKEQIGNNAAITVGTITAISLFSDHTQLSYKCGCGDCTTCTSGCIRETCSCTGECTSDCLYGCTSNREDCYTCTKTCFDKCTCSCTSKYTEAYF